MKYQFPFKPPIQSEHMKIKADYRLFSERALCDLKALQQRSLDIPLNA
jgi:hypothetical protein